MVRRHKRAETLEGTELERYLAALGAARGAATKALSLVRPFSESYVAVSDFIQSLDDHQAKFTGDATYFHCKPAPSAGRCTWWQPPDSAPKP